MISTNIAEFEAAMQHVHCAAIRKNHIDSQINDIMKTVFQSIRLVLVLTVLTGIFYPMVVTILGGFLFPKQAGGSLIVQDRKIVGSSLLAQKFEDVRYFWPRPSGAEYATVASGATNKGPTSVDLVKAIADRRKSLGDSSPVDMLTASASGLDPHISPEAARFQVSRVAVARKLSKEAVAALVERSVEPPQFAIFGEPRVNVLALNRALDQLH